MLFQDQGHSAVKIHRNPCRKDGRPRLGYRYISSKNGETERCQENSGRIYKKGCLRCRTQLLICLQSLNYLVHGYTDTNNTIGYDTQQPKLKCL